MPKFPETTLKTFTKPPSDFEESKLSNSQRMVREAIKEDPDLNQRDITVFGQGSYANDTNVRLNSDIDINVRLDDVFYFKLPEGKKRGDFGLNSPSDYGFAVYKDAVQKALIRKFGEGSVKRKNKCLFVEGNTNRVDTDVVPTFTYKRYSADGSNEKGVKLIADKGTSVVNFPLQHIENGKNKNGNTYRRFKRLTRIYRRVRYKMIEDKGINSNVTSFLLECLVWNAPNRIFTDNDTWTKRLKQSIVYLYEQTKEYEYCKEWGEVSELLYLFQGNKKWTYQDVNTYLTQMWNYLEYGD